MTASKIVLNAASGVGGGTLGVEDVFSTTLWTGDNSTSRDIVNNIDLSGEGGAVWIKRRDAAHDHYLYDTERGATKSAIVNGLNGNATQAQGLKSFNSDGFTVGDFSGVNATGNKIVSWTFRKAPKFFTCLTYTGDGTTGKTISHDLGSRPGFIAIKRTDASSDWFCVARNNDSNAYTNNQTLNYQFGFNRNHRADLGSWATIANDTTINLNLGALAANSTTTTNINGATYVAYLWAHNDGDGEFGPNEDQDIIKCGTFVGGSTGAYEIDIGFEPQWVLIKKVTGNDDWVIFDTTRGMSRNRDNVARLFANSNALEDFPYEIFPHSDGFALANNTEVNNSSFTYCYVAIRKGLMNTPTDAADVFDIDTHDATEPLYDSGFPVDFGFYKRTDISGQWYVGARLLGGSELSFNNNSTREFANSYHQFDYSDGWGDTGAGSSGSYSWMWRQAHSYFDVVGYKGDGSAGRTVSHNLGVTPEMMWVKNRSSNLTWPVWHKDLTSANKYLNLGENDPEAGSANRWNNTAPTASVITLGSGTTTNQAGSQFVAFLFASADGVSKVGSYSGNGTTLNIDCGFSSGARFVLIKRTDTTGSWWIFDTDRGLVAGNDAAITIDLPDAQFSTVDYIDPYSAGFSLTGTGGDINASGGSYIFYAVA